MVSWIFRMLQHRLLYLVSCELYIQSYGLDSFQLLEIIFPSLLIISSRSSSQETSCLRSKNRSLLRLCNVFCLAEPISSYALVSSPSLSSAASKLFCAATWSLRQLDWVWLDAVRRVAILTAFQHILEAQRTQGSGKWEGEHYSLYDSDTILMNWSFGP